MQQHREEQKFQQRQQTIAELQKDKGFVPRAWQEHGAGLALPPGL